jgi:two-component system nitrogen regulation response regulator GlnG/two-component system response regulator HydG
LTHVIVLPFVPRRIQRAGVEQSTLVREDDHEGDLDRDPPLTVLVVAWCEEEPGRLGQVLRLAGADGRGAAEFGRGVGSGALLPRATFVWQRAGESEAAPPLQLLGISRRQLLLRTRRSGGIAVENVGRCPVRINGVETRAGVVDEGDTLELGNELVFVCVRRPRARGPGGEIPAALRPAFGSADAFGIVGESPATWALRARIAFVAAREGHVLVTGESGTGKELVARAVHGLSSRATARLVSRNAATLPEGLVDAELFGHADHYPSTGMRQREGLVGRADGSTLFLDEIGELPAASQAHLLRVLDHGGEYHRLGEAQARRANVRVVAATNRPLDELKADLAARFKLRVAVPTLADRREDVPMLIAHLLSTAASNDPALRDRFFAREGHEPRARVHGRLVAALVRHEYTLAVRELETLLWTALATSPGDRLVLTQQVEADLDARRTGDVQGRASPADLDPAVVQAVLDKHDGVQERAWRELGLKNRHVLIRLIRKHGLSIRRASSS